MTSRQSILYIEDDVDIAEMYRLGLTRHGFDVVIAPEGPAGIEMLRNGHYDLVLLDVMLPGMDGIEVLAAIRADAVLTNIPIAILSNSELGRRSHEKARMLGILGWMTKAKSPPSAVARSIRRWLRAEELTRRPRGA